MQAEQDKPRGRFDGLRLSVTGIEQTAKPTSPQSDLQPSPQAGRFAGLKLGKVAVPEPKVQATVWARRSSAMPKAHADIARMQDRGIAPLEMHKSEKGQGKRSARSDKTAGEPRFGRRLCQGTGTGQRGG
jgi:hypothetical protein